MTQAIKEKVREAYGRVAEGKGGCCGAGAPATLSQRVGYADQEIHGVPEGANLGLGCGNPLALAAPRAGEIVVDLGSGAGFDVFLAAGRVGGSGRVIGVDFTPEMVAKATENARKGRYDNVEFRLGDIDDLPLPAGSADVVISNCAVNLVPDKARAFREAFRVLKPGGRLIVADIVLLEELPPSVEGSPEAYVSCLAGAMPREKYLATIRGAGFAGVEVLDEASFGLECIAGNPAAGFPAVAGLAPEARERLGRSIASVMVRAVKPF
jgi:arsenite methyltransferase